MNGPSDGVSLDGDGGGAGYSFARASPLDKQGFGVGGGGGGGGKTPVYADPKSRDGDFFNYLERFQKQTEQLRHHLDPSAAPGSPG